MSSSRAPGVLAVVALTALVCCAAPLITGGAIAIVGGVALSSWVLGLVGVGAIGIAMFVRRWGAGRARRDLGARSRAAKG